MTIGGPKAELILTAEQEEQLKGMTASRSLPAGLVIRARQSKLRQIYNH
jgi:hypothetical protein